MKKFEHKKKGISGFGAFLGSVGLLIVALSPGEPVRRVYSAPPIEDGLVLQLDADAIKGLSDGNQVEEWEDMSGHGNNAWQGTAANQPTYKTHIVNNMSVVRWHGGQRLELPDFLSGATGGELLVVLQMNVYIPSSPGPTGSWSFGTGPHRPHYTWTDGNIYEDFGRDIRPGIAPDPAIEMTAPHIYGVSSSTHWTWRQNGKIIYDDPGGNVSFRSNPSIGARDHYYFDGDIAEILVYNRPLSDSERKKVEMYLGQKWLGWPHHVSLAAPDQLVAARISGPFIIKMRDKYGRKTEALEDTAFKLSASGQEEATFYEDKNGEFELQNNTIIIEANQSHAIFYYKDTQAGTPTISVRWEK